MSEAISNVIDFPALEKLADRYGQANVESACIFLTTMHDRSDVPMRVALDVDCVERILRAVWADACMAGGDV